jgi:hypothetical protein
VWICKTCPVRDETLIAVEPVGLDFSFSFSAQLDFLSTARSVDRYMNAMAKYYVLGKHLPVTKNGMEAERSARL